SWKIARHDCFDSPKPIPRQLSLIPQRHHRIHSHRPPRRQPTRRHPHDRQQPRHHHKRPRIRRRNFKQQTPHHSRHSHCSDYTHSNPHQRQPRTIRQHQSQHIPTLRAQGHANPNLMPALPHPVRHRPVNSHGRERQRKSRERSQQQHVEPVFRQRNAHRLFHGPHLANRDLRVHRPDLFLNFIH